MRWLKASVVACALVCALTPLLQSATPVESNVNKKVLTLAMKRVNFSETNSAWQDTLYARNALKDTTMFYHAWRYVGIQVVPSNPADSSVAQAVILASNSPDFSYCARVDSITGLSGSTPRPVHTIVLPVSAYFAVVIEGGTGNGNRSKWRVLLSREGGE